MSYFTIKLLVVFWPSWMIVIECCQQVTPFLFLTSKGWWCETWLLRCGGRYLVLVNTVPPLPPVLAVEHMGPHQRERGGRLPWMGIVPRGPYGQPWHHHVRCVRVAGLLGRRVARPARVHAGHMHPHHLSARHALHHAGPPTLHQVGPQLTPLCAHNASSNSLLLRPLLLPFR